MGNISESIVLVGGGGGVYRLARFLKNTRRRITTIQTVFDHGGHSGELRDDRGVLPPGDLRQAIVALSAEDREPILRKLMSHRFKAVGDSVLNNVTIGNLLLTALTEIEGSLPLAIKELCDLCGVKGRVLPVSLDPAELCVELSDGSVLKGEGFIDTRSIDDNRSIRRAFLEPRARIFIEAYEVLEQADKIVLCPGDLYTSLVPNLLVEGFREALEVNRGKLIYCTNIMTKKAETHGYSVGQFVSEVSKNIGHRRIDLVIYNNAEIGSGIAAKYAEDRAYPVTVDELDPDRAIEYIGENLVDESGGIIRHHGRIASIIADL